jgi:hypothetical protein
MEPRQLSGFQGVADAVAGFSWKPVTRLSSSTSSTPKRRASPSATSIAPTVSTAPRAMWTSSILP